MRYRKLGDSDIEVSEVSLGSWLTYGAGLERDGTEACTRAAFDAGITLFDTSNVYGVGAAEEAWGQILSGYPRDSYVLATKVFFPMSETDRGLSREQIHKQLEASLARLQTDYVDLYQCHRPDPETPIEETMEALTEVCEAGKVRALGFSEWTVEQIQAGLDVPGAMKWVVLPAAVQHDLASPRRRADPLLRRARHLADRLVAARPRRPCREVQARGAAAVGFPGRQRLDGLGDGPLHVRRGAGGGSTARPGRRRRRHHDGPAGARLGSARAERGLGHHRRVATRPSPLQRRCLRDRALARHARRDRRGTRGRGRERAHGSPTSSKRA